jgi:hypothetical protein
MIKKPDIAGITAKESSQNKILQDLVADPDGVILEMKAEQVHYGQHRRRMAELAQLAALEERILHRMLEKSVEEHGRPKRPQLKVVK